MMGGHRDGAPPIKPMQSVSSVVSSGIIERQKLLSVQNAPPSPGTPEEGGGEGIA